MEISEIKQGKHLGGGVVVFEQAVSVNWESLLSFCDSQVEKEHSEMYEPATNPETGAPAYVNRSGYIFDQDGINKMPRRSSRSHVEASEEIRSILDRLEDARDSHLLAYMHMFPTSYKNIWWKVKGHIVSYSANLGNYLGKHSDTSADYVYGLPHPSDQLATRNTVSCVIYLGSCSHHGIESHFSGGHHYFNYLDIDYCPKRGDILMFPANYIATHEVMPVTYGVRYSYLGWYSHGTPNSEVNEEVVDPLRRPDAARVSTNVYMPDLRQKFVEYLSRVPGGTSSDAYQLARGN